ncbi:hypothetical protein PJE062_1338 [Pseudovibrio sp. JE062]|nr:hypothetical protein PJE062_1338 [Pseudovibrio sp. JE062]
MSRLNLCRHTRLFSVSACSTTPWNIGSVKSKCHKLWQKGPAAERPPAPSIPLKLVSYPKLH